MLSALMWLLYLYFIRDALAQAYALVDDVVAWMFEDGERPFLPVVLSFLDTLKDYGVVIAINGVLLIGWALYNQLRFQGEDRRTAAPLVTPLALAELYALPAEEIERWQQARILTMQHAPDGTLTRVNVRPPTQGLDVPSWVTEVSA